MRGSTGPKRRQRSWWAAAVAAACLPVAAHAQSATKPLSDEDKVRIEQQLGDIKATRQDLSRQVQNLDARVEALEAELHGGPTATATPPTAVPPIIQTPSGAVAKTTEMVKDLYDPNKGFVLARSDFGEIDLSAYAYLRYLDQNALDPTYTDSFGRTTTLDRRQDLQVNKTMLYFKGWAIDPKLTYMLFIWTTNANSGDAADVAVGGFVNYAFNPHFILSGGAGALPTTRSTNYTFPNWLKVDHRTIADEFFRGSYTTGIWATGEIVDGVHYRTMIGNDLSQLGVDAVQLDRGLNTVSTAIWWMPTTGEFGRGSGFGDLENHQKVATLFGAAFTRSRESAEAQPGVDDFENTQLRLSDGTLLFKPNAFNTGGQITRATYQMADVNAGVKYRGMSLDLEYYFRWLGDFETTGVIPVQKLYDHGFQAQASAMVVPGKLQIYVSGSKIFGQYGNPSDFSIGGNWYPFARREFQINVQAMYLNRSPVGYSSAPWLVGGNGWVFSTDYVLSF